MINIQLLHYELEQGKLPVVGVSSSGRIDYSRALTSEEETLAQQIIINHNPNNKLPWIANADDAKARFLASAIANKTPAEIYTLMQNAIDSWSTLAQAKNDLRNWLPLMAAIIAWKVVDQSK